MGLSLPHLIVVALIILVLFGRGRISEMMGDFGKGVRSFKDGMTEETTGAVPPAQIAPPRSDMAHMAPPTPGQAQAPTPAQAPVSSDGTVKPGEPIS